MVDSGNLARWKYKILFPIRNAISLGKPVSVHVGEQQFHLVPEGAVAGYTWSNLLFERHELEFILRMLEPGMVFWDVGANVGLFSIAAAKKIDTGKVYSFEPCQWTYERLVRNIGLNSLGNVIATRTALADFVGEAALKVNVQGKDGLNTLGEPTHSDSEVVGEETVPVTTLDEFMRDATLTRIDLMKVDVEGGELLFFRGARNLLKRDDAPVILYECGRLTRGFGYHPVEAMWFLEGLGYCSFVLDPETGQVKLAEEFRGRDVMAIAAKPEHPCYPKLWDCQP